MFQKQLDRGFAEGQMLLTGTPPFWNQGVREDGNLQLNLKKGTNKVTILVFSQISLYLYISSERKWNRPHLQFKSALLFSVLIKRNNDL